MKLIRCLAILPVTVLVILASSALAAPVESVDSSRASATLQKIDAFLGEQAVVAQMQALGLDRDLVHARLAQLSDAQLQELATQIDQVKAGGTIQDSGIPRYNPVACVMKPLGRLLYNIYQLVFCWGRIQ